MDFFFEKLINGGDVYSGHKSNSKATKPFSIFYFLFCEFLDISVICYDIFRDLHLIERVDGK